MQNFKSVVDNQYGAKEGKRKYFKAWKPNLKRIPLLSIIREPKHSCINRCQCLLKLAKQKISEIKHLIKD